MQTSAGEWGIIVAQIKAGEDAGMEKLYKLFSRGIRYYLCRQLGPQEIDDKVNDTFLIVVKAIQRGDLREPERLMGFVRTVVRRQVANYIEQVVRARREQSDFDSSAVYAVTDKKGNPEQQAMIEERAAFVQTVLRGLSQRDQDLLVRFYLQEQTIAQICAEMALAGTQFRLLKSRAKARFGDLGRRRLGRPTAEVRGLRSLSASSTT